jgi:hypothetical protein
MADKIKKGSLVRAIREKLENSVEAQASDSRFPPYLFETKGEVVDMKGDYALVKFGQVPTPNIWLRIDQLEVVVLPPHLKLRKVIEFVYIWHLLLVPQFPTLTRVYQSLAAVRWVVPLPSELLRKIWQIPCYLTL